MRGSVVARLVAAVVTLVAVGPVANPAGAVTAAVDAITIVGTGTYSPGLSSPPVSAEADSCFPSWEWYPPVETLSFTGSLSVVTDGTPQGNPDLVTQVGYQGTSDSCENLAQGAGHGYLSTGLDASWFGYTRAGDLLSLTGAMTFHGRTDQVLLACTLAPTSAEPMVSFAITCSGAGHNVSDLSPTPDPAGIDQIFLAGTGAIQRGLPLTGVTYSTQNVDFYGKATEAIGDEGVSDTEIDFHGQSVINETFNASYDEGNLSGGAGGTVRLQRTADIVTLDGHVLIGGIDHVILAGSCNYAPTTINPTTSFVMACAITIEDR